MLCELRVSQLGVIEDLAIVLGPGMTALTGETGAGKTLVVEAVELLLGGRAGPVLVRPGANEALVEGRFNFGPSSSQELVVSRVVPREGRSRAYINGSMATAGALADLAGRLVDLHGQHEQQSLLSVGAQRQALDAYAGTLAARALRDEARERLRRVEEAIVAAGGSSAARQKEMELLRYQLDELESAKLSTPDEDLRLAEEQEALSRAAEHRAAAALAHELLAGEEQVCDRLGHVVARVAGHPPLASLHSRLRSLAAELADAAEEARSLAESLEDDPERLAEVTERRALLHELRRKYGGQAPPSPAAPTAQGAAGPGSRAGQVRSSGGLEEVFQWRQAAEARLEKLESLSEEASRLASEHSAALAQLAAAAGELGRARREAAGRLGRAVEVELRRLAMPRAHFSVQVGGPGLASIEGSDFEQVGAPSREPSSSHEHADEDMGELSGENVCFLFAANAGEAKMPLAKVASGGELARVMLALRLVLLAGAGPLDAASEACGVAGGEGSGGRPGDGGERLGSPEGHWTEPAGPGTLVFDEVDAGIGGEAALAVGRALAELGERYQVVVVTHLPQVAAFAKSQIVVSKSERAGRTVATAAPVSGDERVVELSRMLSGQPGSKTARLHAEELLRTAAGGPSAGFRAGGPRARRR